MMDIKQIAIYTGAFIGSFLVMIILIFYLFPVINPEETEKIEEEIAQNERELSQKINTSIEDVEMVQDSALTVTSTPAEVAENRYKAKIDSLEQEIEELTEYYEQQLEDKEQKNISEELENATKTLLNLDDEVLAPIANRLDNDRLLKLYRAASNMQRERLLKALEPEKASEILKNVVL